MMPQQKSENHSTTFLIPRQWPVLVAPFPSVVYLHIPFHLESTIQIDPPCPSGTRRPSSSVAVAWSLLHHQQFRDLWKIITTRLHFTLALSLRIPTSPPPSPLLHYYYLPLSLFALLRCIYNWRDAPLFLCSNKLLLRLLLLLLCFSRTHVTIPPAPVELNPVV